MADSSHPHRVGVIPEHPSTHGGRLGRHLHFDERSKDFPVSVPKAAKIVTRTWERTLAALTAAQEEAERLGAIFTRTLGTRSLDILHIANALVLGIREFLTFDVRQAALAKAAGLKVPKL